MQPSVFKSEFNFNVYNALWSVEESNEAVNRNDYQDKAYFLQKSAGLLAKYNLEDKLGIRLLHKHNAIKANELMIEREGIVNDEKALVTKPSRNSQTSEAIPHVWKIVDGNFYPLEFTTDPLAHQLYSDLQIPDDFLNEYRDQVNSSPIGEYLGISIIEREFYNTDGLEDFPLEYSDLENRTSVIFLRSRDMLDKAIETAWSFRRKIDVTLGCEEKTWCTNVCRNGCWKDGKGNHDTVHDYSRHNIAREHKYVGI